jgi:organic hydroperoxide reductase OsmC/OhrA
MERAHKYQSNLIWTGNIGQGTSGYQNYTRDYTIQINGKVDMAGSADAAFRGDASKHNPEELLLMALSSCHMLWYLHLCADVGVIVTAYQDQAEGTMLEQDNGMGKFTEVILHPRVTVKDKSMLEIAESLHVKAHAYCFIANSVNFPVKHVPIIEIL